MNHYYADNLTAAWEERVVLRLQKLAIQDGYPISVNLAEITRAAYLRNKDQAVYNIHDILEAYYKVAIKRFMDNVVMGMGKGYGLDPQRRLCGYV